LKLPALPYLANARQSLKINYKLGGTSHVLSGETWYGAKPKTMIVGADVSHVAKGADSGWPSMAGLVATRDSKDGQYLESARLQPGNVEVSYCILFIPLSTNISIAYLRFGQHD
jgi:hypothetical protein